MHFLSIGCGSRGRKFLARRLVRFVYYDGRRVKIQPRLFVEDVLPRGPSSTQRREPLQEGGD